MTECLNEDLRDLLPLLAHGSLSAADAGRVRAHMAGCAACAAELSLLQSAAAHLEASAPALDLAAITQGVQTALAQGRPALRVVPGELPAGAAAPRGAAAPPRRTWVPRQYLAAAATILVVVSLAIPFTGRNGEDPVAAPTATGPAAATDTPSVPVAESGGGTPGAAAAREALVATDGLSDLTDADLEALLDELETLEATVSAEPGTMRRAIVNTPGGI